MKRSYRNTGPPRTKRGDSVEEGWSLWHHPEEKDKYRCPLCGSTGPFLVYGEITDDWYCSDVEESCDFGGAPSQFEIPLPERLLIAVEESNKNRCPCCLVRPVERFSFCEGCFERCEDDSFCEVEVRPHDELLKEAYPSEE